MKKRLLPLALMLCIQTPSHASLNPSNDDASIAITNEVTDNNVVNVPRILIEVDKNIAKHYQSYGVKYTEGTFLKNLINQEYILNQLNLEEEFGNEADDCVLTSGLCCYFPWDWGNVDEKDEAVFNLLQKSYREVMQSNASWLYVSQKELLDSYKELIDLILPHYNKQAEKDYAPPLQSGKSAPFKSPKNLTEEAFNAVMTGDIEQLKKIVCKKGFNINVEWDGKDRPRTLLEQAIISHQLEIARYLVSHTDIDIMCKNTQKRHYLHMACKTYIESIPRHLSTASYASLVRALLDKAKELLNSKDESNNTAFFYACGAGNLDVIDTLVAYPEIEFNSENRYLRTPAQEARLRTKTLNIENLSRLNDRKLHRIASRHSINPIHMVIIAINRYAKSCDISRKNYEADLCKAAAYCKSGDYTQYNQVISSLVKSHKNLIAETSLLADYKEVFNRLLDCEENEYVKDPNFVKKVFEEYIAGRKYFFKTLLKKYPDIANSYIYLGCNELGGNRTHHLPMLDKYRLLFRVCRGAFKLNRDTTNEVVKLLLSSPLIKTNLEELDKEPILSCALDNDSISLEVVKALVEHPNTDKDWMLNKGVYPAVVSAYHGYIYGMGNNPASSLEFKAIITYLLAHECTDSDVLYQWFKRLCMRFNSNTPCIREVQEMIKRKIVFGHIYDYIDLPMLCLGYIRLLCDKGISLSTIASVIVSYVSSVNKDALEYFSNCDKPL